MKRIFLLPVLLLILTLILSTAEAQYAWKWVLTEGGTYNEYITAITTDANGNIYVAGAFQDTVDFFGETLASSGSDDVFVASFASSGNLNWVRYGGGTGEDIPLDICTDDQFIYVTGLFNIEATFENETITSNGVRDMFLLKYSLSGDLQWATYGGGVTEDEGNAVAADGNGNVYVAGDIGHTATFGSHTVNYFGFTDIFAAKYDAGGTCQWATSAGGPIWDYGGCIGVKGNDVFIGGSFNDVAVFDTATVTSVEYNDIFIAHYMSDGSFVEVVSAGGAGNDILECMAVDNDLNVYAGGHFMLDMTIGNNTFSSNGSNDIFLAKYEPGTGFIWSNHYGSSQIDEARDMDWDMNGNLIVTGTFENTMMIGSTQLISEGYDDGFLLRLDANGNVAWVYQLGGSGSVTPRGCAADHSGNYYAAGDFLDELKIGSFVFNPAGAYDLFIARLGEGTGIDDEIHTAPGISIFPNPCRDVVKIRYKTQDSRLKMIEVFSMSGNKISELVCQEAGPGKFEMEIDVSGLPAGVYALKVLAGNEIAVRKLVVSD